MTEEKTSQWISFRVKPEEYKRIHQYFTKSTHRKLSEYARKVLLQQPINVRHRNESADDFLKEMIGLKNELNAIGNNYNQAIKKLHTLNNQSEIISWLSTHEILHQKFQEKIGIILKRLNAIHQQWSSV